MDSLYPLDHLYVSWVKLYSFLYLLSIMTKRGRNTCLYKGEMCFILLGGVLTSLFLYFGSCDHYWHTLYLSSLYVDVCLLHLLLHVLFFFFFLYTHVSLFVCNLLFLSHTKMFWWVLFKVFQKYRLSKSTCHKLSSCKVFQEFVLG